MKLLPKIMFIGASLMGSAAYAGCNTGDSNPVECDWTINLGTVSGGPFQACLPAKANIGIPTQVCWLISPDAGAFSELTYYSSATSGMSYNNYVTFIGTNVAAVGMPPIGTTQAQVDANFPEIILWTFETAGSNPAALNATIQGMMDRELLILATAFIANNGDQLTLHQLAATYLDSTNLVRWQAAFTQAQVNPFVGVFAPNSVSSAYFSHPALRAVVHGGGMPVPVPAPDPNINMSIYQIYIEYRMQAGATALSAMTELLKYAGSGNIKWAAAGGWTIGTYFYKAMVAIDPSYGYDLVTTYGAVTDSFGPPIYFFLPGSQGGSQGYVTNPDGSVYDGYGNLIYQGPPLSYGVPTTPSNDPPPYYFYDPFCLIDVECTNG